MSVNKETGEKKQVTLYIYTVTSARQYDSGNEVYNAELNQIRVRTGIGKIVGEMANLRMGDIIAMKGSINTKNVPKGIKCPNCGALINVAASSSKKKSVLSISEPSVTDSSDAYKRQVPWFRLCAVMCWALGSSVSGWAFWEIRCRVSFLRRSGLNPGSGRRSGSERKWNVKK